MIDRPSRFIPMMLALLASTVVGAPPAAAQDDLDALKQQTVKIEVTRSVGPKEFGSGVVLCQKNSQVYVLTAHHVLAGKSDQPSGKNTLRLRRIRAAEVSFFGAKAPPVGKDDFVVHQVPGEDLLLLEFPLEQVLAPASLDSPAVVDEETEEEDRPVVFAVGYWKDRAEAWAHRRGTLLPGGGKLAHHSGDIAEGFSGGPLFNEAGSLIGINIERVSGEAIGATIGSWYGEALAMQEILPAIGKWVPSDCLKSASPLSELAYLTYRKAMRSVSIKRWPQAEVLMGEAIAQQPLEGGSVHLEGLRYTPYLPLYHHGLAHYKLAGQAEESLVSAEHYATAIRQWERSEAQGEIQGNKRYKTLKRLKEKSYKALQRETQPQTEREKVVWAAAREQAQADTKEKQAAKEAKAEAEAAEQAAQIEAEDEAAKAAEEARRQEITEAAMAAVTAIRAAEEKARREAEAKAETEAARDVRRRVIDTGLPCALLRPDPSLSSGRLRCLAPGIAAMLLEERNDWSRIRLGDGAEGWMASRLLERVEASVQDEEAFQ